MGLHFAKGGLWLSALFSFQRADVSKMFHRRECREVAVSGIFLKHKKRAIRAQIRATP